MTRAAVVAVVLAAAACREVPGGSNATSGAAPGVAPAPTKMYSGAPGSFVELVDRARHGVVAIHAAQPVKSGPAAMFPGAPETLADVALGTGFLVEAQGVFVLTNEHVAAASAELRVVLEGGAEVPARVIGRDVRLDLALLALDPPTTGAGGSGAAPVSLARLHGLPLGDSDDLRVGEWVVVLGDPFGDAVSASAGIVSATGREGAGSLVPGRAMGFRTFLQTDARVTRGNSGGPMIDTAGQVVGVAVATGDRIGELSFAIPSNRVREVIGALRDTGDVSHSWLGALAKPVTPELAQTLGMPKTSGAWITEIKAGSPAARAGLRAGDVILRWAGRDVDDRSLPWLIAQTPPGKTIELGIWRDRVDQPLAIVTEKMPE